MLTELTEIPDVTVDDIEARPEGSVLIDVREPEEFCQGHVPGAVNVPQSELASRLDELPRNEPLYVICEAGYRSCRAAQFLAQRGFENMVNVDGGTSAWRDAGKPMERDEEMVEGKRIIETEWAHAGVAAQ
jgi:rhodanese-related sulfurtransferase